MADDGADKLQERMVGILTTIHFTLQTERVATISEANGRSALYLTAVSACLIALGFIAQATAFGTGFYLFAFILFAVLAIVGVITFTRVVQTGLEDMISARGIARIRRFYTEVAPGIERWFVLPVHDGVSALHDEIGGGSRFQTLLTTASMVAVVTCALVGVLTRHRRIQSWRAAALNHRDHWDGRVRRKRLATLPLPSSCLARRVGGVGEGVNDQGDERSFSTSAAAIFQAARLSLTWAKAGMTFRAFGPR